MRELQVLKVKGLRVLTTRQLAEAYGTKVKVINNNFSRNKERYILEKHYFYFEGEELSKLRTTPQFEGQLRNAPKALFWTEKGALLHAKSLNTDKAWEVYDYLVDFYFRAKEVIPAVAAPVAQSPAPPELSEWEKKIIAYNRGVVRGVYRAVMEKMGVVALDVYNLLSCQVK